MEPRILFRTENRNGAQTSYQEIPSTAYARREGCTLGIIYIGAINPSACRRLISEEGNYDSRNLDEMLRRGEIPGFIPGFEAGLHPLGVLCALDDIEELSEGNVTLSRRWKDHFQRTNHLGNLITVVYKYKVSES